MPTILFLTGKSHLATPVFQAIRGVHHDTLAIVEEDRPRLERLRERIRRRGPVVAFGQVGFRALYALRARRRRERIDAIWRDAGLTTEAPPAETVETTAGFDTAETLDRLRRAAPRVAVVFATRRLPGSVRDAVGVPILNLHPGLLPVYRGVHTGYWALRRGDRAGFGVSVHLIDDRLDTGPLLARRSVDPIPGDDVACYAARLTAAGVPLLLQAIDDVLAGRARPSAPATAAPAPICLEPTLWSYLAGGLRRGVW